MVLLEVAVIIGAVVYYRKKKQEKLARNAAWASGNPYVERNGGLSYPPPAYNTIVGEGSGLNVDGHKIQREYYGGAGDGSEYQSRDGAPVFEENRPVVDEKKGSVVETKEIQVQ